MQRPHGKIPPSPPLPPYPTHTLHGLIRVEGQNFIIVIHIAVVDYSLLLEILERKEDDLRLTTQIMQTTQIEKTSENQTSEERRNRNQHYLNKLRF